MRIILTAAALAMIAAGPLAAASPAMPMLECQFQNACIDGECDPGDYAATLRMKGARPVEPGITMFSAEFEDSAESYAMQGMIIDGHRRLFNIDSDAGARLLTIGPDGTARYTTHIKEPLMAITYFGQCEDNR